MICVQEFSQCCPRADILWPVQAQRLREEWWSRTDKTDNSIKWLLALCHFPAATLGLRCLRILSTKKKKRKKKNSCPPVHWLFMYSLSSNVPWKFFLPILTAELSKSLLLARRNTSAQFSTYNEWSVNYRDPGNSLFALLSHLTVPLFHTSPRVSRISHLNK